jgi:hypothetical protein
MLMAGTVISQEVRRKLSREQRRMLAMLRDLRTAAEATDANALVSRASRLEESLDAHLAFVSYVLEALSDDDPQNYDAPRHCECKRSEFNS